MPVGSKSWAFSSAFWAAVSVADVLPRAWMLLPVEYSSSKPARRPLL